MDTAFILFRHRNNSLMSDWKGLFTFGVFKHTKREFGKGRDLWIDPPWTAAGDSDKTRRSSRQSRHDSFLSLRSYCSAKGFHAWLVLKDRQSFQSVHGPKSWGTEIEVNFTLKTRTNCIDCTSLLCIAWVPDLSYRAPPYAPLGRKWTQYLVLNDV